MKIKKIINDIWRNFKMPLALSVLFAIIVSSYVSEFDFIWGVVAYVLSLSPIVAVLIYGIKEYFKK